MVFSFNVFYLSQNNKLDRTQIMVHMQYTVKPAHAVTSIKQSPVLKGHLFVVLSLKISYELNLF